MHAITPRRPDALDALRQGYVARRNFFNFFGINCRIMSLAGLPLLFVRLKAFRLKEAITIYADAAHTEPLFAIQARQIIDFSAAYDLFDHVTSEHVATLKRKGLKSLIKDEWELFDHAGEFVGLLEEDSWWLALLRRLLSNLIPQNYHLRRHGEVVASFTGTYNPFIVRHTVSFTQAQGSVDVRMVLALSVLLLTIEGKQR